jgi:hypothetical protein
VPIKFPDPERVAPDIEYATLSGSKKTYRVELQVTTNHAFMAHLSDFRIARPAMCSPFGVERPTVGAAVIHLTREQVGDDRAQDENAAEDSDAQERIFQPLYFSLSPRW